MKIDLDVPIRSPQSFLRLIVFLTNDVGIHNVTVNFEVRFLNNTILIRKADKTDLSGLAFLNVSLLEGPHLEITLFLSLP